MSLLLIPLGFGLAGLLIGRWLVVALAMLTWIGIALFLLVNDGWYGAGWGDFGIEFNMIVAFLTVLAATVGVLTRKVATALFLHRAMGGPAES
jgi:hypothetical protein